MVYLSLPYFLMVGICLAVYYLLPPARRWLALLFASLGFYVSAAGSWKAAALFAASILLVWLAGLGLERALLEGKVLTGRCIMGGAGGLLLVFWFLARHGSYVQEHLLHKGRASFLVPLGISFYTLLLLSYLEDIRRGKIRAEKSLPRFALFASFFPQIVQGPIPRYDRLSPKLKAQRRFEEEAFTRGLLLILWGFFLKLLIADKAAVIVDAVFGSGDMYRGFYVLVAGILYSIQLYADFSACVSLSQGVAALFGIELGENFQRPYLATSVQDFWRRWHISLSQWLRDYVYIPLGGSRRGKVRRLWNLLLTFVVSGLWHGAGVRFLFWGLLHGFYQIAGSLLAPGRERIWERLGLPKGRRARIWLARAGTFFWVMLAWIIFRADSLREGLDMILSMVRVYNPWILFDESLFGLGLSLKEWIVLAASVLLLAKTSLHKERGGQIRDAILRQPTWLRYGFYLLAVLAIWLFGTYGYGFRAQDFIYGGF